MSEIRLDGRAYDQTRPVYIEAGYMPNSDGSVLIQNGGTQVICAATIQHSIPPWMRGQGRGWVSAEYGMLPNSTIERIDRRRAATSGRTKEIERLIGRSLRAVTDLRALGERSVTVDCDVLRADGGTRTTAITGGYVALALALMSLGSSRAVSVNPLIGSVSAVSVGILDGQPLLDLDYEEDSHAEVDMNVVMTGNGDFIELQGTAEGTPFTGDQLDEMLDLARAGCAAMMEAQQLALQGG